MYDLDSNVEGKWENQSRQTISRDETLTDVSNLDYQADEISNQMKNLCLNNNYVENTNNNDDIKSNDSLNEKNNSKQERKMRKHRVPFIAPHFISNITFDYYGNQDIHEKSKYRRRRKMVPHIKSTFKIAYDKEELEQDLNNRAKKPISPTYISHVFDKDEVVRKVRPVHKNSIFYDNICFDNYGPQKSEYKPPLVIRDKYISNIFSEDPVNEVYKRHRKSNPNISHEMESSSLNLNGSVKESKRAFYGPYSGQEDHMNRIFAEPSIDNLVHPVVNPIPKNNINYTTFRFDDPPESPVRSPVPKDKYVSTIFRGESLDNVPTTNVNDLSNRAGIYSRFYFNLPRGIKTKYNRVDHVNDIFSGTNEKLNFNDIRTMNNIHNSMHQSQRQAQRV